MTTTGTAIHTLNHKEATMATNTLPAAVASAWAVDCAFDICHDGEHVDHVALAMDAERYRVELMRAGRIEAARSMRIERRKHYQAALAAGQDVAPLRDEFDPFRRAMPSLLCDRSVTPARIPSYRERWGL